MRYGVPVIDEPQPPAVADDPVLLVQPGGGADRAADGHPDPVRVEARHVESAVGDRAPRRDHGELGRPVHPAALLRAQAVALRVEVDLGRHPGAERGGVEERDAARGRAARVELVPELLDADAPGREHVDARDDDSPAGHDHASHE
nr:hypothetical protein GCM10020092_071940 [Actinoplanes digitatis]